VIEVADIVRRFGPSYLEVHGASVLPSHRRALFDTLACRTDQLGGHLWRCTGCSAEIPSYHGCGNRSCPKCHRDQTADWLAARSAEMLPTGHFHVTVTVPEELRDVLRRHQQIGYGVLMSAAAAALVELARDPRYVGGTVGVLAVLHTWTQQLHYHPHVHCLVTGGGVSADGAYWQPPVRDGFLVPVKALGKLIRGKVRAELARRLPTVSIPRAVWRQPCIARRGLRVSAVCSTISPVMSSALLSPTAGSRPSMPRPSPSATRTAKPASGAPAACRAMSSCAASASTSCPRAFIRSATTASGIPPGATCSAECARG
jgi:hypothetical protein